MCVAAVNSAQETIVNCSKPIWQGCRIIKELWIAIGEAIDECKPKECQINFKVAGSEPV